MDTTTDNTYLLVCYVGSSRNSYMMYEYAYYELIVCILLARVATLEYA